MRNMTAISFGTTFRINKYTGSPTSPASVKPIICLLVKLKATFVFTFFRSFGIGTYAITYLPSSFSFESSAMCSYTEPISS